MSGMSRFFVKPQLINLDPTTRYLFEIEKMLYEDLYTAGDVSKNRRNIHLLSDDFPCIDQRIVNIAIKEAMFIEDYLMKCRHKGIKIDEEFVKSCIEDIIKILI